MVKYLVRVLGCKVNQYEAAQIRQLLNERGAVEAEADEVADLVVVHSCAVTAEAVRKVRNFIRRGVKHSPNAKIIVSGCAAKGDIVERELPGYCYVRPGKGWLTRLNRELDPLNINHVREDGFDEDLLPLKGFSKHHRAFLKIQDGCDICCTYCIVPRLRGPSRDKPLLNILDEAEGLVASGHKEIVITGVSVGLYGKKSGVSLARVVNKLAGIAGIERLRLSSLHPAELTDELLNVWAAHPKILPHIHLPLQSGSDRVLRDMGRGYTRRDFLAAVERAVNALDRPAFNTDIIVGFPGETETDFNDTAALCREVGFARIHIFQYSPRPGTRAASLDGGEAKAETVARAARLKTLSKELEQKFYARFIGTTARVLTETFDEHASICRGYTERYIPTSFPGDNNAVGRIKQVRLVTAGAEGVEGAICG